MNKQLAAAEAEIQSNQALAKHAKRQRIFKYELGKFLVDIAKLVFAGVIIAGIMNEDINRLALFLLGSISVVAFGFIGLLCISLYKEDK